MHERSELRISWSAYDAAVRELAAKLSDFEPDVVAGVERGGAVIAVHLSHLLEAEFALSRDLPASSLDWRRVALVDDIADTGDTLRRERERLRSLGYDVATASLFASGRGRDAVDHYVLEAAQWIVFPWET